MALVSIVMGSDSDMPVMAKAAETLEEFGISFEMRIISAHREPELFFDYARTAEDRGVKVIIAYSIVQMPSGIPVATVAIGGAKNAAVLAAKILAVSDDGLREKLKAFERKMKEEVAAKDARLQENGYREYGRA